MLKSNPKVILGDKVNEKKEIENAEAKYKSEVWKSFGFPVSYDDQGVRQVERDKTICKRCFQVLKYSGNTSNMNAHLNRRHPTLVNCIGEEKRRRVNFSPPPCSSNSSKREQPIDVTFVGVSNETKSEDDTQFPMVGQLRMQQYLKNRTPLAHNSEKAQRITRSIGMFMAADMRPYCVVDNPGFRNMIKTLEPLYVLPSRTHFSNTVIPQMYRETRDEVVADIQEAPFVSLTTDGWTSRSTDSFITITAHFIDRSWELKNYVLQTRCMEETHSSENLSKIMSKAVEEWELTREGCSSIPVTTDNASNVVKSITDSANLGPNIRCFAHTINLASQKGLKVQSLGRLLGKIRSVVKYFHHSAYGSSVLKSKQGVLDLPFHSLIMDVTTRWNSTYDMLNRYYEQHEAIMLSSLDLKKQKKDLINLSDDEILTIKSVAEGLQPMKIITNILCSEKTPTISLILPLKHRIKKTMVVCDEDSQVVKDVKGAILNDITPRYKEEDLLTFLQESTALDPRFRSLSFLDYDERECEEIYGRIQDKCINYHKDLNDNKTQEVSIIDNHDSIRMEISDTEDIEYGAIGLLQEEIPVMNDRYSSLKQSKSALEELLGSTVTCESKELSADSFQNVVSREIKLYREGGNIPLTSNPLHWWKANQHTYPILALQAKRYLGVPGTSVPSERVFSTTGDIVSAQRNCLGPENVDILSFLKKNMKL